MTKKKTIFLYLSATNVNFVAVPNVQFSIFNSIYPKYESGNYDKKVLLVILPKKNSCVSRAQVLFLNYSYNTSVGQFPEFGRVIFGFVCNRA